MLTTRIRYVFPFIDFPFLCANLNLGQIMGKGIFGSAGSIWTVVSQENPDESIGLIHAVEGRDKPERSRMALNLDCVEFNSDPNNPAVRLGVAR
jgi:hypothetical protein